MTPEQLKNVTPAPWVYDERVGNVSVFAGEPPECLHDECPPLIARKDGIWHPKQGWSLDETDMANMAFIALARNAFDIMVRRKWFPRFVGTIDGKDGWVAYSWVALKDVSEIAVFLRDSYKMCDIRCTDPFTALVETDAWYKANVEGKQ